MKELEKFTDNVKKIITGSKDDGANYQELSQVLGKNSYTSKLDDGMEYNCEELVNKVYSYWLLENEVSFIAALLNENLVGLMSEKLQAEAAEIISEKASDTVRQYMQWGMGRADDFAIIHSWIDVLKEVDSLPVSAPCDLSRIKSLRSASKKKIELTRLWGILFKARQIGSKYSEVVSKSEAVGVIQEFVSYYPEITNVYGFSDLLKAIESSAKRFKRVKKSDPLWKHITTIAKIIAGRAKVVICRASLNKRKKAEAWFEALHENHKRFENKNRKFTREEILFRNITTVEEAEFQSILKSLYEALLDQRLQLDDKQKLIDAIKIIYRSQNIPSGTPPWYPELLEEPYYPNADLTKCAHFIFVLGKLEQGNLSGRWEKESLQYLLKNQTQEGYWSSSTFRLRPDNETTVAAIHALALWKPNGWEAAIKKAAAWLWTQQHPDGGWAFYSRCNWLILEAIDLAEGKLKYSLKMSDSAFEAINGTGNCELKATESKPLDFPFEENPAVPFGMDGMSIKESFTFRSGQVLLAGKDLAIKTGAAQDILEKLVCNFGFVVPFKELNLQSNKVEASVSLRSNISYLRQKMKRLPIKIENRRQSGYIMQ